MKTQKNLFFWMLFTLFNVTVHSQDTKSLERAEKYKAQNNIESAILEYTKAIEQKPDYSNAYLARAECYQMIEKFVHKEFHQCRYVVKYYNC